MACYIASNENRVYVALESDYGLAAAVSAQNRIPAVKLGIRQSVEQPRRRDKTGGRTFSGLPNGFRKHTTFDLLTYMTNWDPAAQAPCYGPLFQAAMGAAGMVFGGATVDAMPSPTKVTTATPHGLAVNQAVRFESEIRFVTTIEDELNFFLNAPFSTLPGAGGSLGKTVTFLPAGNLPSATLFDYWTPATAVQRVLSGSAVDRMRISVNGDFHQFGFAGVAGEAIDSPSFSSGLGGLTSFPEEPSIGEETFPLIPGSMGQAWFGISPSQFHTVLSAEVVLNNNLDLRDQEFGMMRPECIAAGQREVSLHMDLVSSNDNDTTALYQAASQRSPISAMFQLGQIEEHLCGVFLPAVIPEIPEFDDQDVKLKWRFRNSRAQGMRDDELVVAFA
jgi:hypothetical protein